MFISASTASAQTAVLTEAFESLEEPVEELGAGRAGELGDVLGFGAWSSARQLALLIAVGIGLHNLAAGLAIGGAAADGDRPSWPFLLGLGAIAGGPTFLGTLIGQSFTSDPISVAFLTLAAGSILYVVVQLIGIGVKHRHDLLGWGLLLGLTAGFEHHRVMKAGVTDSIPVAPTRPPAVVGLAGGNSSPLTSAISGRRGLVGIGTFSRRKTGLSPYRPGLLGGCIRHSNRLIVVGQWHGAGNSRCACKHQEMRHDQISRKMCCRPHRDCRPRAP